MTLQDTTTRETTDGSVPDKPETPSLHTIARSCLEDAKGDWQKAADIMQRRIDSQPEMKAAIVAPLIPKVIWLEIRRAARDMRADFWRAKPPEDKSADGIVHLARTNAEDLLQFPLPGGQPLGDANLEELRAAKDFYLHQARGNARVARFLGFAETAMGTAERVRDALTHDGLLALQQRAQNDE